MEIGETDPSRWQAISELFERLRSLPADQQARELEQVSVQDPELAEEVQSLLSHDAAVEAEGFLPPPPPPPPALFQQTFIPLAQGTRIGPYTIREVLGRGGTGTVYLAERVQDYQQRVAIKVLHAYLDERAIARFKVEGQSLAQLVHPNIIRLLDGGTTETGLPYLVMEYIDGVTLEKYCEREQVTVRRRVELVAMAVRAVAFAHERQILHRDLTPANLLVSQDATLKVADFGLSHVIRSSEAARLTDPNLFMGTPSYMAPEQISRRHGESGPAVDCYGLGAILYHVLANRPPYEASSPIETCLRVMQDEPLPLPRIDQGIPHDLVTIVEKSMARNPGDRFGSMDEFSEQLRRFLANEPLTIYRPSLRDRFEKWLIRHKRGVFIWGAVLTCFLLTLVTVLSIANFRISRALQAEEKQLQRAEDATKTIRRLYDQVAFSLEDLGEALQFDSPKVYAFLKKICEVNDEALVEMPKSEQDPALRHGAAIANYFLALAISGHEGGARPEPILERYGRSIELLTTLVDEDPTQIKYRYNLTRSLSLRARFYSDLKRHELALADARESLNLAESLARDYPENPDHQDVVANKSLTVGQAYEFLGKPEEAIALVEAALRLAENLVKEYPAAQYPEKAFYKTNVYRAHTQLTNIWLGQMRFDQAWEAEQKAAVVNEELIIEMPSASFHKLEQINLQNRLAYIRFKLGDLPGAEAWLTRAEATTERLAKFYARDEATMVTLLEHILSIESRRANMYLEFQHPTQAREAYVRWIERQEEALVKYPARTRWRDSLIDLYTNCPVTDLRNPDRVEQLRARK